METERAQQRSLHIDQDKTMAVVRAMMGVTGAREDEDHPLPPGPWDPVIRIALERYLTASPSPIPWREWIQRHQHGWSAMESIQGPDPESWKSLLTLVATKYPAIGEVIGGGLGQKVALNPQPLPPSPERFAFLASLAHAVTVRAELFQEIADATRREGELQSIIIVGSYVKRFADYCGNEPRPRWPFPGPRPHWFIHEINGIDLLVMAVHFEQEAKTTFSQGLRNELEDASKKLAEAGLAKF